MAATDANKLLQEFVDYLLPELTPYETTLYVFLLRHCDLQGGTNQVRMGKRSIAARFGKPSKGGKTSFAKISVSLRGLEEKGCLKVGDTTTDGTLYSVVLPKDVPAVREKLAPVPPESEDYFTETANRKIIFERDQWTCQYCGERVQPDNATLDHIVPGSKGGDDSKANLKTCCLLCNSIKSGRTYEEAAPLLLASIRERRARTQELRGI